MLHKRQHPFKNTDNPITEPWKTSITSNGHSRAYGGWRWGHEEVIFQNVIVKDFPYLEKDDSRFRKHSES